MSFKSLPDSPSLENLKKRAKRLRKEAAAGQPDALNRIGPFFGDPSRIGLQSAQLVIAREHGFSSWTSIKSFIEQGAQAVQPTTEQLANQFLSLVCLHYTEADDPERRAGAKALLDEHPAIARENIYTAAAVGDVAQIDHWLDRDAELINQTGGFFNWPPLMYAAYARLPGTSTLSAGLRLLEHGADPNAFYMWGGQCRFTVLTGAFGHGEMGPVNQPQHPDYLAFVRALFAHGADPNDSQAAYNRMFADDSICLALLLEHGLSPQAPNNWLIEDNGELVSHPAETLHYQLIQAIHQDNLDRVKLLVEHGVDLQKSDNTYDTITKGKAPLDVARLLGKHEIADYLRKNGASEGKLSDEEQLYAAFITANDKVTTELTDNNPDLIEKLKPRFRQMLCHAVTHDRTDALRLMINHGFELNRLDGRRPLHEAALHGNLDTVKLLVGAGADTRLRDSKYLTPPIAFAQHGANADIIAYLDTQPMDLFTAASRNNVAQIETLLTEDPQSIDKPFREIRPAQAKPTENDWATPIVYAALNEQTEAMRYLLQAGASTAVNDGDNRSLESIVEESGNQTMIDLLAQHK